MRRPGAAAGPLLAAALLVAAAVRAEDSALPPLQRSGDISYISGGIGEDESRAIKAVAAQYPLWLTFIARNGGKDTYSAPQELTILQADGAPVLDLKPDGPFLLVNLPAGKYRITAGSASASKTQTVEIPRGGHKRLVFDIPEAAQQ
jgi:hypothetical protein